MFIMQSLIMFILHYHQKKQLSKHPKRQPLQMGHSHPNLVEDSQHLSPLPLEFPPFETSAVVLLQLCSTRLQHQTHSQQWAMFATQLPSKNTSNTSHQNTQTKCSINMLRVILHKHSNFQMYLWYNKKIYQKPHSQHNVCQTLLHLYSRDL